MYKIKSVNTGFGDFFCGGVASGKADDCVAVVEQFLDDCLANKARSTRDEDTHVDDLDVDWDEMSLVGIVELAAELLRSPHVGLLWPTLYSSKRR